MRIITAALIAAIALSCVFFVAGVHAEERITSFSSDITVNEDSTVLVRETIRVVSEQNKIRHGIYRDFPTTYKDKYGHNFVVAFDVQSVVRDNLSEDYHTESISNGTRVYIGKSDTMVDPGEHTYILTYLTNRQIGFFDDHDELYWNVTGTGWEFPIDQVQATVTLPPGISASSIKLDGWTGPQGSTAKNVKASLDASGRPFLKTTTGLGPSEGLTIAVAWPKGFVNPPTQQQQISYFLHDNRGALVCILGLFVVLAYFLWAQMKVGIDPTKGAIVPQWEAPEGLSPAAVRFISRMGSDNKAFSCALISAAVKGHIELKDESGTYTITRKTDGKEALSPEESAAVEGLLGTTNSITLEKSNNTVIREALSKFGKSLSDQFGKGYFARHTGYFIFGLALSILTMVGAFVSVPSDTTAPASFLIVWLTIWTFGVTMLIGKVIEAWRGAHNVSSGTSAGCTTLFAVPFVVAEIAVLVIVLMTTPMALVIAALLLAVINGVFFQLLKAYTKGGRMMMDRIEGLRMYMRVAEQERLEMLNPPDRTPELFEKLLPYALALGVEQQWSEQFADVLARAQAEGYHPGWYAGPGFYAGNYAGFASSVGDSFSSAIASSSTPPGSGSGGFGGGGSSGGGGGGGGGGGW